MVAVSVVIVLMVQPISGIIVQHIDNGYKHLVMMMMWHHGMGQYQHIGQQNHQHG